MTRRDDPFFDVPRTVTTTSEGDVELPIGYFEASHYLALFRVDAALAAAKLAGTPLAPVLVARRAVATLSFFKYLDTELGPYHEVGLALLVTPRSTPRTLSSFTDLIGASRSESIGSYVLDLPVSTHLARAAGCEIWGYPKFVARLPIELEGEQFQARVLDHEGRQIMELAGTRGLALPETLPGMTLVTYSQRQGQWLRTRVETRSLCTTHGGGSLRLTIGDSPHRMADDFRNLGLDGQAPKLLQSTDDFRSLLFAGTVVDLA